MKRSRFTEEQIIGILKEHQAGFGAKDLFSFFASDTSMPALSH